jgi:hypothetical protein
MAIIDTEKQTQILRKVAGELADYEAMKLPISELRVSDSRIFTNPGLDTVDGVATWTINVKSPDVMLQLQEVETKDTVVAPYEVETIVGSNGTNYALNIYLKTSDLLIDAGKYKAVVIG